MATKTDRNQHTTGTHGKSQTRRAWHWRLTDSQSAILVGFGNAAVDERLTNNSPTGLSTALTKLYISILSVSVQTGPLEAIRHSEIVGWL